MSANSYDAEVVNERIVKKPRKRRRKNMADLSIVPLGDPEDKYERRNKERAMTHFRRSVKYVKTVLDKSEEEMSKIKIKELPKLVEEAQDKMTVGHMNKLMRAELKDPFMRLFNKFLTLIGR